MYVGNPNRKGLAAGPMAPQQGTQFNQLPQHAVFPQEEQGVVDMAKQMAMSKGVEMGGQKAMEYGAPLAKEAMGYVSNLPATMGMSGAMGGASIAPGSQAAMLAAQNAGLEGAAGLTANALGASTTGAAGAGAMAGLGAAMPWIGAGLLGAKMFGLFSEGGLVGPLAGIKYKSMGGEVSDEFNVNFVSPLNPK